MDLETCKTLWSSLFKPPTCRLLGVQVALHLPCRRLLLSPAPTGRKHSLTQSPFWAPLLGQTFPEETLTGKGSGEESRGRPSHPGTPREPRVPCRPAASFRAPRSGNGDSLRSGWGAALEHQGHTLTGQAPGRERWLLLNYLDTWGRSPELNPSLARFSFRCPRVRFFFFSRPPPPPPCLSPGFVRRSLPFARRNRLEPVLWEPLKEEDFKSTPRCFVLFCFSDCWTILGRQVVTTISASIYWALTLCRVLFWMLCVCCFSLNPHNRGK